MDRKEENEFDQKHAYKQALPFCIVKIFPKDSFRMNNCKEVLSLFLEKDDEQSFQISEKIRNKVLGREKLFQRINDSKDSIEYINRSIEEKVWILRVLYETLDDLLSSEIKFRGEELLTLKKMLHKSKILTQEKSVLRKINVSQQQLRESDDTTSILDLTEELIRIFLRQAGWRNYDIIKNPYRHNYDRILQELKKVKKETTCDDLRECLKNEVKFILNELMELNKKIWALETKIKNDEKKIEGINQQIWSFQTHLKGKHCKKEASLFLVKERKPEYQYNSEYASEYYWEVGCGNLEYDSLDSF
ncbi:hypothetical protein S245_043726, partial [Arachis hypogaea]